MADGDTSTSPRSLSFTSNQIITGQLSALNADNNENQVFNGSMYLDDQTWEVQSNKTIILDPGNFEFSMLLTKGVQQYTGSAVQAVSDGVTVGCPIARNASAQIPACGITAPGSLESLASVVRSD